MMDAKTEQALRESIAKWEKNSRVRKLENAKIGAAQCPLCLLFHSRVSDSAEADCVGCPVFEVTDCDYCESTPFEEADFAYRRNLSADFRAAAKEEVAFLKSLLPENNQ